MLKRSTIRLIPVVSMALFVGACSRGTLVFVPVIQPNGPIDDRLVIGEVMMHSEFAQNLRALCMDGGRLSGSENARKAEQFVADKTREYGLSNVHFEPFEMLTWRDKETVVTVLDDPPRVLEGAIALGNSLSTPPEGVTGQLVSVGKGRQEDFEAVSDTLDGKIAFTIEGALHRSEKMSIAREHGAAGMIQVSRLDEQARVGQCHATPRPEPGIVIIGNHGKELSERLEAGQTITVNIKVDATSWEATPNNVVAEIPGCGSLAHEVVIVSAHLDSWHLAQGAIDNGNGSAAILEAARALASVDWKPRRTIRFVWFMGEEHGLHGSTAYVEQHMDELDDIVAVFNVDMPGNPKTLYTFGHPEIVDFLKSARSQLAGFGLSENIKSATWTASDHAPFMKQGVCAITLGGDLGPGVKYYHSSGDKYEIVDLRGTVKSAAAIAVIVRQLADCPQRPTTRLDPEKLKEQMGW